MTLARISPRPSSRRRTIAAAVSSQVVSIPRTSISFRGRAPRRLRRADRSLSRRRCRPYDRGRTDVASRGRKVQSSAESGVFRIGTRGSPLALKQAQLVRDALVAAHGLAATAIELVPIRTSGDRIQDRPLAEAGGKGLFAKEIEQALLEGAVDLAVHSAKDLPTILPSG